MKDDKLVESIKLAIEAGRHEASENEIIFIGKELELIKAYACGRHIQLRKMLENRKKALKKDGLRKSRQTHVIRRRGTDGDETEATHQSKE